MQKTPRFTNTSQNQFISALRERVDEYFKANDIKKGANYQMILRSIFVLSLEVSCYCLLLFGGFSIEVNYLLWALLGVSTSLVCINIGHDAIHGSYSRKKWINSLLSHSFNFNGASAYMWTKMHNTAHHTYTNIDGLDEDIESVPFIRLSPTKDLKKVHKYQHIYSLFFYGLATLSWVLAKDYIKFFKNEVGNVDGSKHPRKEYFYLFFYKMIYYAVFIVTPFIILDYSWVHILLGILVMHYFEGFYLAIVFMLAHAVEITHFPVPNEEGNIENSWLVHQLYTTANFSRKSRMASFLTGGLNMQVEHHLFPNVCSIHYRRLSYIVKDTCKEYGYPYLEEKTFGHAVLSHIRFLKNIGRQENYQPSVA